MVRFWVVLVLMVGLFAIGLIPCVDAAPPSPAQIQAMRSRSVKPNFNRASSPMTGYTKHGINRAITKDGVGVNTKAIRDAVMRPKKVIRQSGGTTKYVGQRANVVLNRDGKVVTTHSTNKNGHRIRK